ncbi:MAG: hypothetical protein LH679_24265 [Cyanobacteria bacterium CAN_BIN43]|nr:hypothetical protein [Cyanobacteria bacterium CAN_BIN43]
MREKDSVRSLRVSSVQKRLKEPGWSIDSELLAQIPRNIFISAVYKNLDGRVLTVSEDGAGVLYGSIEAWLSLLQSLETPSNQTPTHLLHERLSQGQNFINQISELITELAAQLDIPIQQLDRSGDSLKVIDKAIHRKGQSECLEAEIFAPLVAYVGEVFRQRISGRWEMRLAGDPRETILNKVGDRWEEERVGEYPEVWEPWIVDEQGQNHQVFSIIYDELTEAPRCRIHAVLGG